MVKLLLSTAPHCPCNYGHIPHAIAGLVGHFFEYYKDHEPGKFVKLTGRVGVEEAKQEIMKGVTTYRNAGKKPAL